MEGDCCENPYFEAKKDQLLDAVANAKAHESLLKIEGNLMDYLTELHRLNSHRTELSSKFFVAAKVAKELECLAAALRNLGRV